MKKVIGAIVTGVIILIIAILLLVMTKRIPTGYIGIIYSVNGGTIKDTISEGWHFIAPGKKVTDYSVALEQSYLTDEDKGDSPKDESFNLPTSDGKMIKVNLEFSYRFDRETAPEVFKRFKGQSGESIKNSFIKPKIVAWSQEVSASYPVTDVFGDKRTEINADLDKYLKEKFEPYGIIIDTVNLTNISVDEATEKAIQKKVNAQQELELARIEAQTSKVQAEKDKQVALIEAQKNKEVAATKAEENLIKAKGEANAIKAKADAEAEANRKIAQSLTPELIEKMKYEKWNGTLPSVSGSSGNIVDLR